MTVGRICSCGTVAFPGDGHLCATIAARAAADNRRRAAKSNRNGVKRAHSRRLRQQALDRDGGICRLRADDGCTVIATTVHLLPELRGDHDRATIDDVVSACAHCHGVVDAPRVSGRARIASRSSGPTPPGSKIASDRDRITHERQLLGVEADQAQLSLTDGQRRAFHKKASDVDQLRELPARTTKHQILAQSSLDFGREIVSVNDLSRAEASIVLDALEQILDGAALPIGQGLPGVLKVASA